MADETFLAMRAGLIERGLLSADYSLTVAGNAHVEQLIDELRGAEAPCDPDSPRVFWNLRRRRAA